MTAEEWTVADFGMAVKMKNPGAPSWNAGANIIPNLKKS